MADEPLKNLPGPTKKTIKEIQRDLRSVQALAGALKKKFEQFEADQSQKSIANAINALTVQVTEVAVAIREVGGGQDLEGLAVYAAALAERVKGVADSIPD
jgi:hypothetical protein